MYLTERERQQLADELLVDLGGRLDGSKKNILVRNCPFCGHDGNKYGIYIGPDKSNKTFGMSNCFHCGRRFRTLTETLKALGRDDLIPKETEELADEVTELNIFGDEEIDDSLVDIEMPEGYKRTFRNQYLKSRGWGVDEFNYFPAGTNRGMDRKFEDYVLLEIHDAGRLVGYVGRHTWSKDDIDEYNSRHRFKIRRYQNSTENEFSKLLYNYDSVKYARTDTVILCEGVFDCVGLTKGLNLYENDRIKAVATFGKKISMCQMMKLQEKRVKTIVIGYDNDDAAKDGMRSVTDQLEEYFDVFCVTYPKGCAKDFGEMDADDMYEIFCNNLKTPREYFLTAEAV